ncbi:MAG TPA: Hsp70 family protein [Acetobacteraceae bacterium]|nr:Hsp70 family protein [Acetobacteraceae bacterium]
MIEAAGIDFGTTNSVVALLLDDGSATTQRHASLDIVRSLLCFWTESRPGRSVLHHAAGPGAITAYLEDPLDSRLIMSMKTFLAQKSFTETRIFGHRFTLPRLIGWFLRALLADLPAPPRVIVGRPVRFAGELADDALGAERLRAAYAEAGWHDVRLALEPEAAGMRFARTLDQPATALIGDFGGGTSDFSVMRFDPSGAPGRRSIPLGHAGVAIAGDVFDFRIIDRAIAPLLGKGDTYRVMGKALPVPPEYYSGFARWHLLSLMRTPRTLRAIAEVARTSQHPERLRNLIALIEDGLGYALYQTVSTAKADLSRADSTVLNFRHQRFAMERGITRAEFESWIEPDLARLAATVDRLLEQASTPPEAIDRVFLTGGTAFVPAVRRLFEQRFGPEKLAGGGEFVSVAEGLALIGAV